MIPKENVMGNALGRKDAIINGRCVKPTFGCGRKVSVVEISHWPELTTREYTQSGLCIDCQARVFGIDESCSCNTPCCRVDVGVGVMTCGTDHCYVHGWDAEYRNFNPTGYDPDLREDEPPHDISDIVWPQEVL